MSKVGKSDRETIGVIDIFAGPGGLGEGFSNFRSRQGKHPFKVAVSAEMEKSAHATLQLRAFLRLITRKEGRTPPEYYEYLEQVAKGKALRPAEYFGEGKWKEQWQASEQEALNLTLGQDADNEVLYNRISEVQRNHDEMILIGGPPCQAYSLVGRAKQNGVMGFKTQGISKHFLYRQYLRILADFKPALFIMENVKGILTSTVGGREMFKAIRKDLADPASAIAGSKVRGDQAPQYELLPIHITDDQERTKDVVADHPERFVIHCEDHGAPQARHRVIIMGVRGDLVRPGIAHVSGLPMMKKHIRVEEALAGLPRLRSGLSRQRDDAGLWREAVEAERSRLSKCLRPELPEIAARIAELKPSYKLPRISTMYAGGTSVYAEKMRDPRQSVLLNHETRGHMQSDLGRYMFCAAYAQEHKQSPKADAFPWQVAPDHHNWGTGVFADRFRVQLPNRPSNTVTSHLSKDGHAFIHWDGRQCRSLTVREAARLQTFPDNYLFLGNRTQQYVQVGNAVPPLVAEQIARVVWDVLNGAG